MHFQKKQIIKFISSPLILFIFFLFIIGIQMVTARGLTIPDKEWGICFGNSPIFSGLRFNFMDKNIKKINGINFTLWKARDEYATGTVNGLSLGIIPYAEKLNGIQIGVLGAGARENLNGISIGFIGVGCGEDMKGINIGGIGAGCGGSMTGINLGLLGAGAGENVTGINMGGLGIGAGNNLLGLNIGGLGVGAGENVIGINIGGLGIGAGEKLYGINIGGLGVGAGENVIGINIAGIGTGAGNNLIGLTICGIGAGAPTVKGVTIAGIGVGGKSLTGLSIALGTIQVRENGIMRGLAISAYNYIKGTQKGISIGIVNYAYRLKGVQIGLINIIRDNPRGRKILPIINFNF